ncbi:MAG: hypothetical protein HYY90_05040, partial [Candidatus Omnitrophica bacterium]|nr:hypothetical protein [Candidatus Omnitrophota bacterium]
MNPSATKQAAARGAATRTYRIAVIPGDGTGPEVIREGCKVLDAVVQRQGVRLEWRRYDVGGERY